MFRCPPVLIVLVILVGACSEHAPSYYAFTAAAQVSAGTGSTDAGEPTTTQEGTTTGPMPENSSTSEPEGHTGDASSAAATGGEVGTDSVSGGAEPLRQPRILEVDMPETVHLAGPVAVTVTTADATLVRARLDGVELGLFEDQGKGVFAGEIPIFGAVDNGAHVLEVIAAHETLADLRSVPFTVSTPAAGGLAWGLVHPTRSTSRRVAVTSENDMIEVGALDVDGVLRPSIRKRSAALGAEMWPEGTIVLDEREGSADAMAVLPDGQIWVAMNVRGANNKWLPRIVLLDADGHETGVEMPGEFGATVRGIAADDAGGFFAVGFAGSGFGDQDIVVWRMNSEHVAVISAKPWNYNPSGDPKAHDFSDFAFDVVVRGSIAWVVGASQGKHDLLATQMRGLLVQMDLETAAPLDTVFVQPPVNAWRQGMYVGAAPHPDGGIVVTGNEAIQDGTTQRLVVSVFDAAGKRTWHKTEISASVAYGNAVAWSAHGVAVVAGVVQAGDMPRGIVLGRGASSFDLMFPPSAEPSAANGIALDGYDQAFVIGEMSFGGVRQARAARVHQ